MAKKIQFKGHRYYLNNSFAQMPQGINSTDMQVGKICKDTTKDSVCIGKYTDGTKAYAKTLATSSSGRTNLRIGEGTYGLTEFLGLDGKIYTRKLPVTMYRFIEMLKAAQAITPDTLSISIAHYDGVVAFSLEDEGGIKSISSMSLNDPLLESGKKFFINMQRAISSGKASKVLSVFNEFVLDNVHNTHFEGDFVSALKAKIHEAHKYVTESFDKEDIDNQAYDVTLYNLADQYPNKDKKVAFRVVVKDCNLAITEPQ